MLQLQNPAYVAITGQCRVFAADDPPQAEFAWDDPAEPSPGTPGR
ncbi:MAG TPA: hypothetical protein VHN14_36265 [Kofleriaceae bacterium]|nr:hypothetical protein [Kofleriaceae bacterium]